jgi:multidrug resistance efflux pump
VNNDYREIEGFQSEFIGRPPNSITKYGISIFFFFILILLFFAWKIDYSDSIVSTITINSENPTINYISENEGIIKQIFINDDEELKIGDNIILLSANIEFDIFNQLKACLLKQNIVFEEIAKLNQENLGSFRTSFQNFYDLLIENKQAKLQASFLLQQESINLNNLTINNKIEKLKLQLELLNEKTSIFNNNYLRAKKLNERDQLSNNDLGKSKSIYLEAMLDQNRLNNEIFELKSMLLANNNQLDLNESKNKDLLLNIDIKVNSQKNLLINEINLWENKHLIKSPINGLISLPNNIFPYQTVSKNQELFSITPYANSLIGKIQVSEYGAGKILIGQKVDIGLNSYPHQEFGKLWGTVINKTSTVHESSIFLDIEVNSYDTSTKKFKTTYNKLISYIPNMQGTVEIITNKKTVLSRILESLYMN